MTKQQIALKLALEALEANQPINYCLNSNGERFPMMQEDPFRFERNSKAITAIREALAEQPAQQTAPCGWRMKHNGEWVYSFTKDAWDFIYAVSPAARKAARDNAPAQQQEPVAKVDYKQRDGFRWLNYLGWQRIPDGASLYTSPPASKPMPEDYTALEQALTRLQKRYADLEGRASKPWVGLDEEEIEKCCFHADSIEDNMETWKWTLLFYEAVATKLREKNT